jgi:hypothetical protein
MDVFDYVRRLEKQNKALLAKQDELIQILRDVRDILRNKKRHQSDFFPCQWDQLKDE